MTFLEEARAHLREWNRQLREADPRKHFLPSRDQLNRRKFPGVDADRVDAEWAADEADQQEPQELKDGTIDAQCSMCGEVTTVAAPGKYEFVEMDGAHDDDKVARWRCACGAPNRLDGHRLRKISEAVATFRSAWREGERVPPPQAQEPVEAFRESYGDLTDAPSLDGLGAITEFDRQYHR